jgi:hypothetical protein
VVQTTLDLLILSRNFFITEFFPPGEGGNKSRIFPLEKGFPHIAIHPGGAENVPSLGANSIKSQLIKTFLHKFRQFIAVAVLVIKVIFP